MVRLREQPPERRMTMYTTLAHAAHRLELEDRLTRAALPHPPQPRRARSRRAVTAALAVLAVGTVGTVGALQAQTALADGAVYYVSHSALSNPACTAASQTN